MLFSPRTKVSSSIPTAQYRLTMKQSVLAIFGIAFAAPAFAQFPLPIIPGKGKKCPSDCIPITTPIGAVIACCAKHSSNIPYGCADCTPQCIAACPPSKGGNNFYGGCTDLGGSEEENCSRGCSVFCDPDPRGSGDNDVSTCR